MGEFWINARVAVSIIRFPSILAQSESFRVYLSYVAFDAIYSFFRSRFLRGADARTASDC